MSNILQEKVGEKVNNVNKLGSQHKMYQRATELDVARQPMRRYV